MPRSYLIPTLVAIVLLAVSAATAHAQQRPRIAFSPHVGTVNEGATADADSEHPLLTVTVRVWNLPAGSIGEGPDGQPTARQQAIDALGEITIETEGIGRGEAATIAPVYDTAAALDEDAVFAASDTFQLTVTPVQDDDARNDKFTLRLRSTEPISTGSRFSGTVIDDDPLATATFSRTDVSVFEGSHAPLSVRIAFPGGESIHTEAGARNIVLKATPSTAVSFDECSADGATGHALRIWSERETLVRGSGRGEIIIDKTIFSYPNAPAELRLTACADMSDYRDSAVTLAFKQSALETPVGRIASGPPAVIQILNADPLPSVSLTTAALTIEEGMSETVAILADGDLASAVTSVGLAVDGDARLSLLQDGRRLVARGGAYILDTGGNSSTILTIRADGDENLADGETKTATVTIVDASGADIGDRNSVTVTVNGSTAVPALPLVGQLLLALLLLAGPARLYFRRQSIAPSMRKNSGHHQLTEAAP